MNDLASVISYSRQRYLEAAERCEENIQTWKKHEQDYLALKEQLDLLQRKITHDVMVPFGKVAFMPGRLIHTNEILILLGDNWFVERSAFQALEIVDRRLKYVTEMIKKYEDELKLYHDRLEAANRLLTENETGDYLEIREPIQEKPGQSKKVRIAHKPKTASVGEIEERPTKIKNQTQKVSDEDFAIIMKKLDELGRHEKKGEEELASSSNDASTSRGRRIMWQDDITSGASEAAIQNEAVPVPEVEKPPVKSILKNREATPVGELPPSPYEEGVKTVTSVHGVFRETVVERIIDPTSMPAPTVPEQPRRVSKFAQERAGLKKK